MVFLQRGALMAGLASPAHSSPPLSVSTCLTASMPARRASSCASQCAIPKVYFCQQGSAVLQFYLGYPTPSSAVAFCPVLLVFSRFASSPHAASYRPIIARPVAIPVAILRAQLLDMRDTGDADDRRRSKIRSRRKATEAVCPLELLPPRQCAGLSRLCLAIYIFQFGSPSRLCHVIGASCVL